MLCHAGHGRLRGAGSYLSAPLLLLRSCTCYAYT